MIKTLLEYTYKIDKRIYEEMNFRFILKNASKFCPKRMCRIMILLQLRKITEKNVLDIFLVYNVFMGLYHLQLNKTINSSKLFR